MLGTCDSDNREGSKLYRYSNFILSSLFNINGVGGISLVALQNVKIRNQLFVHTRSIQQQQLVVLYNIDNTTPTPTCLYHRNQWIHTTTIRYINKPTRNLNTKQPIIVYIIYPSWSNKVAWCHCLSDHYVYTCSNHIDSSSELDHSVTLDISRLLRPMFVYCYSVFILFIFPTDANRKWKISETQFETWPTRIFKSRGSHRTRHDSNVNWMTCARNLKWRECDWGIWTTRPSIPPKTLDTDGISIRESPSPIVSVSVYTNDWT